MDVRANNLWWTHQSKLCIQASDPPMHSNTLRPLAFPGLSCTGHVLHIFSRGPSGPRMSKDVQGTWVAQFMMTQSKGGLFSPGRCWAVHYGNPLWWLCGGHVTPAATVVQWSRTVQKSPAGAKAPKQAGTETKPCRVDMVTLWAPLVACTKLLKLLVGGLWNGFP